MGNWFAFHLTESVQITERICEEDSESGSFPSPEEVLPPSLGSLREVTIEPSRKYVCSEVWGTHESVLDAHPG